MLSHLSSPELFSCFDFITLCVCIMEGAYTQYCARVEVRGQLCGVRSFLPPLHELQGLHLGHQACTVS